MEKQTKYQQAVAWIAYNDNDSDTTVENGEDYLTIVLVADVFDKPIDRVATDVRALRLARCK